MNSVKTSAGNGRSAGSNGKGPGPADVLKQQEVRLLGRPHEGTKPDCDAVRRKAVHQG